MKPRLQALRSLRWNHTWKGILGWLLTEWVVLGHYRRWGFTRIWVEPRQVLAEQEATAEGVFV